MKVASEWDGFGYLIFCNVATVVVVVVFSVLNYAIRHQLGWHKLRKEMRKIIARKISFARFSAHFSMSKWEFCS